MEAIGTSGGTGGVSLTEGQASSLLRQWLHADVLCRSIRPLSGGICSTVFLLEFDAPPHSAVVKLQNNTDDDPLPHECARLEFLEKETNIPCPKVYLQDASREIIPYSFLLLERLPGINLESAGLAKPERAVVEMELAEACADLHSHTAGTFHAVGSVPEVADWTDVFLPKLEENRRDMAGFLPEDLLHKIDQVLPLAEEALRDYGEPTLIHNDLWAGNIMVVERSDGWHLSGLLDPVGLQYAEVEKELAYLQAFNTVGEEFFTVYSSRRSIREGFDYRKLFYWLNTYMIHVWLGFGTEFHERIARTCLRIKEEQAGRQCIHGDAGDLRV